MSSRWHERLTVTHASLYLLAASWGFGGNIYWIRLPLALWGTLAIVHVAIGLLTRSDASEAHRRVRWWLVPWLGWAVLVALSVFNPNYTEAAFFETRVYRPVPPPVSWLPSSARPALAAETAWLLSGLYFTGLSVALFVRRRGMLRALLLIVVLNTVTLAVFGTLQALVGADGLYFGAQPSPQPAFFSTFIYHNHWGPFALLSFAAALALAYASGFRDAHRGFWHSPAPLLLGAAVLMGASIPLSTSRSSTLLLVVMSGAAGLWLIRRSWRSGAATRSRGSVIAALSAGALVVAAIAWLAAPVLQARWAKTVEQVEMWRVSGNWGGRVSLYGDTWRMALDRPWTGWGLESFETVFVRYNQQGSPRDHLRVHYDQAHSDWLQAFAETGGIGLLLLLMIGLLPLVHARRALSRSSVLPRALLGACGLIALYGWVEFPFANPAVVLLFWISFFGAIRYAQLEHHA